jgi:hypothetical protein
LRTGAAQFVMEWTAERATLEEWTERFGIAVSSKDALNEDTFKDSAVRIGPKLQNTSQSFSRTHG